MQCSLIVHSRRVRQRRNAAARPRKRRKANPMTFNGGCSHLYNSPKKNSGAPRAPVLPWLHDEDHQSQIEDARNTGPLAQESRGSIRRNRRRRRRNDYSSSSACRSGPPKRSTAQYLIRDYLAALSITRWARPGANGLRRAAEVIQQVVHQRHGVPAIAVCGAGC
jgi:hypothetical protein